MWWFNKNKVENAADVEDVEDRGYTDAITEALVDSVSSTVASSYVAALEIAAGQLSRAFMSAEVQGDHRILFNPWVMAQIGRSLVEEGETVWYRQGRRIYRAYNYSKMPNGEYQISTPLEGGKQKVLLTVSESRVFHARWNIDLASERGLSPLGSARTLRKMLSNLENSLAEETGAAVGYLLPVPADGESDTIEKLKKQLKDLKGRVAVVETARGGWGEGTQGAPRSEYALSRMGADIPDGNVELYTRSIETVLAACGYPVQLYQQSDGTAQREAWRRYLHGTVAPLGNLVISAANTVGLNIEINWENLFASDISGRSRAFGSLVAAGMNVKDAANAAGIKLNS